MIKAENTICSICQCNFSLNYEIFYLDCNQIFHSNCSRNWFREVCLKGSWLSKLSKNCQNASKLISDPTASDPEWAAEFSSSSFSFSSKWSAKKPTNYFESSWKQRSTNSKNRHYWHATDWRSLKKVVTICQASGILTPNFLKVFWLFEKSFWKSRMWDSFEKLQDFKK